MPGWRREQDEPISSGSVADPAPGLEGQPRLDMTLIEAAVPKLIDHAVGGPVVLTRHGREAFVLLPLDIWRRVWQAIDRPPVIDMEPDHQAKPGPRRGTTETEA